MINRRENVCLNFSRDRPLAFFVLFNTKAPDQRSFRQVVRYKEGRTNLIDFFENYLS